MVVAPLAEAEEAAELAEMRIAKEAATREVLGSGTLGVDYYGLRARLADLGVVCQD